MVREFVKPISDFSNPAEDLEASARWTMPIRNWIPAMNQFAIEYEDRFDIEENKVTQNK